jgi:hypothetical protein
MKTYTGVLLLFSAGTFLYVATVHILPEIYSAPPPRYVLFKKNLRNLFLMTVFFGLIRHSQYEPVSNSHSHGHAHGHGGDEKYLTKSQLVVLILGMFLPHFLSFEVSG